MNITPPHLARCLIAIASILPACRTHSAAPSSSPATLSTPSHPWPMAHHDAARSGGSMDIPFQEDAPGKPVLITTRGTFARFNAPVITATGAICIGSVGRLLQDVDDADGVTCVDPARPSRRWFTPTTSDAHGASLGAHQLFVGTQDGTLFALALDDGAIAWTHRMPGAITASPLVFPDASTVFIADAAGNLHALAATTGALRWAAKLDGAVISGLAGHAELLIAATAHGQVSAFDRETGALRWQRAITYLDRETSSHMEPGVERAIRIEAAPVIAQDKIILAYGRHQPLSTPPLMALDLTTGELLWEASAQGTPHTHWHNQHVSPVFVEDRLIFVEPHSRIVAATDLLRGDLLFISQRPSCIQGQWSSMVHAADISYVPRHDGTLYAMMQGYGLSPWYVLTQDSSPDYFERFKAAYLTGDCLVDPPEHEGFITTPALNAQGHIVVGRADGTLLIYAPSPTMPRPTGDAQ